MLWLLFLFLFIGICAEDYFCPSLAIISERLSLSDNVAGVTFLGTPLPPFCLTRACVRVVRMPEGVWPVGVDVETLPCSP